MNGNKYGKTIKEEKCTVCGIEMTAKNTVGRLFKVSSKKKCGKCYLEGKRMERRRNGKA